MEKEAITTIVATTTTTVNTKEENNNNNDNSIVTTTTNNLNISNNNKSNGKVKKRGALHMLRVALFMLRRGSKKKSKSVQVEVASKGLWKKVVGAMRPLHHHQLPNQNSPPPSILLDAPTNPKGNDSFHDVLASPMSPQVHPDTPSSSSSSSVDSMSRYASAQNLQELDRSDESPNSNFDTVTEDDADYFYGGDAMIDAKAEEFIAQFYEQMRLQQLDLLNRYNERKRKKKMAAESMESN